MITKETVRPRGIVKRVPISDTQDLLAGLIQTRFDYTIKKLGWNEPDFGVDFIKNLMLSALITGCIDGLSSILVKSDVPFLQTVRDVLALGSEY